MDKKFLVMFIILSMVVVPAISGCTIKNKSDKTWGEKEPAKLSDLYIINSTGDHSDRNTTFYYYIWGYIGNKAKSDASNVEITAKYYDKNGTLLGNTTVSPYNPKIVPALSKSSFYITFEDPDQKIVNYTLNIVIKK
ncbi:FxLYD domain-containing protein [Methanobacterium alcaliphilum]|uniref:FxLYD domain-containing protein n=1 Tax=Methanobacterium alcaliphilum TaxID=392018 RepID=UPI00200AB427|nr:FxLYD domain-containing protein [Methanobacterium alcaliphilum]MCK9150764.1 FxLYD domain-containing protein [Methanobacterium alcaliphilum]